MPEEEKIVEIPLEKILEPEDAIRRYVDEEELKELTKSIEEEGLQEPIKVRPRGDKYEIIDGHMRFLAHKLLKKVLIKAIVKDVDDEEAERIKVHTYAHKISTDPIGEGEFYHKKLKDWNISISELAERLRIPESRIRARLDLLSYPQEVKDAIGKRKISLKVGELLSKLENEDLRKRLLRIAIEEGCSERKMRMWIKQYEYVLPHEPAPSYEEIKQTVDELDKYYETPCDICGEKIELGDLDTISGHRECIRMILEAVKREKEMEKEEEKKEEEKPEETINF